MQPQTMIDYTQLHPQRLGSSASHMHQHSNPSPGALSPNLMSTPPSQAAGASCKFADSTSTTGVASPQDLSTSSGPGRTSPGFGGVGQNSSGTTSTKLGLTTPIASPVEHKANVNQNISSPASSTSSNESNEANNSSSNTKNSKSSASNSSANPPQIYPWMKRVHLGQSKCKHFYQNFLRFKIITVKYFVLLMILHCENNQYNKPLDSHFFTGSVKS